MIRLAPHPFPRYLARPLDVLLGGSPHTAVLRALREASGGETGRAVARRAGVDPHSAFRALADLERTGLVSRRPVGRAHLFTLNRDRWLWREILEPAFRAEAAFRDAVFGRLRDALRGKVASAVVFGSVARGEDGVESDIDLCLIVDGPAAKEPAHLRAVAAALAVEREFGRHVTTIVFTRAEFLRRLRAGDTLAASIRSEGISLTGRDLRELAA